MKRLATLVAGLTLAALTFGCGGDTNDNKTSTNTSTVNVNANKNTNSAVNTNANANANKGAYNANISQEEYNKDKETFGQKAKDLGDKIGVGITDGWLWVKTRGALIATSDLTSTDINVDVNDGVIILRGTVPSADQVKKADAAAKGVSGSKGVQNQLKVAAGGNANASTGNKNAPAKK
jgi:osmotically-inducible protein OsmY